MYIVLFLIFVMYVFLLYVLLVLKCLGGFVARIILAFNDTVRFTRNSVFFLKNFMLLSFL